MKKPAASAFRRLGNRLALLEAQRLDRKPGPPQIGLGHGLRGRALKKKLGLAVTSAVVEARGRVYRISGGR